LTYEEFAVQLANKYGFWVSCGEFSFWGLGVRSTLKPQKLVVHVATPNEP
jgi:hypothetical protein